MESLLFTQVYYDTKRKPSTVVSFAKKVRSKIVNLEGADRDTLVNLDVQTASRRRAEASVRGGQSLTCNGCAFVKSRDPKNRIDKRTESLSTKSVAGAEEKGVRILLDQNRSLELIPIVTTKVGN